MKLYDKELHIICESRTLKSYTKWSGYSNFFILTHFEDNIWYFLEFTIHCVCWTYFFNHCIVPRIFCFSLLLTIMFHGVIFLTGLFVTKSNAMLWLCSSAEADLGTRPDLGWSSLQHQKMAFLLMLQSFGLLFAPRCNSV